MTEILTAPRVLLYLDLGRISGREANRGAYFASGVFKHYVEGN